MTKNDSYNSYLKRISYTFFILCIIYLIPAIGFGVSQSKYGRILQCPSEVTTSNTLSPVNRICKLPVLSGINRRACRILHLCASPDNLQRDSFHSNHDNSKYRLRTISKQDKIKYSITDDSSHRLVDDNNASKPSETSYFQPVKTIIPFLVALVMIIPISSASSYENFELFSKNIFIISSVPTNNVVSLYAPKPDLNAPEYSAKPSASSSSPLPLDILSDPLNRLRSGVTGEKVTEIRVGESLVRRLRAIEQELDQIQKDVFAEKVDWEVLAIYPKIFRTYAPLFTAYTDRAFPSSSPVDVSLRYALKYEIGGFYSGIKDFEDAVQKKQQRQLQRAFARISLAYDRYYKAGDLYQEYDVNRMAIGNGIDSGKVNADGYLGAESVAASKLSYIAPSIEAPALEDEVVMLKGPDKGRVGTVLWIAKGDNIEFSNVVVKLDSVTSDLGHHEVRLYPYNFVAKTTPPEVQFFDDLLSAYLASAISCGIMYPIDSYKTRMQIGKKGMPSQEEGGFFGLYRGVQYFVADANDAVYVASYGLIKPLFLAPVDPTNPFFVFSMLVLSGSAGDAIGSIFRLPMEIVYKRIQAGLSNDGIKVLRSFGSKEIPIRSLLVCWTAILLRDMPFAGLQIALYDIYKSLFAFLDELGWSMFAQSALWGVLAGGTAAWLTTPFDVLTTNILTAIEEDTEPLPDPTPIEEDYSFNNITTIDTSFSAVSNNAGSSNSKSKTRKEEMNKEIIENQDLTPEVILERLNFGVKTVEYFLCDTVALFQQSFNDVIDNEPTLDRKVGALFNGAFERVLFFGPAAMIFFTTYESVFNIISVARERHGLWF